MDEIWCSESFMRGPQVRSLLWLPHGQCGRWTRCGTTGEVMTKWFDTTHTHNNRVGVLWSTNLKVNLILLLLFDLSEDVWHVSQNLNTHIKKKRCEAFTLRQGVEICMVPALFDMETWIPTCWSLKTKATPGRLCDSLDKRHTVLNQCTYVVIDEAPGCCNCELHKLNQIRVWELIFWREFWWPILNPECQELYQADKMVDLGFEEGKYRKNMDKNPVAIHCFQVFRDLCT